MRTIVLYANENGEPQQCVLTHPESMELQANTAGLAKILPDYNEGGGMFVIPYGDSERPDIYGEDGEEVFCHFITLA